jgi:YegS/Rv2252/BmrU family lipid kinase
VGDKRWLLIVNPAAGGGRAGKTLGELRGIAERRLGGVDVAVTERPGHAVDLARAAAEQGRERIVAVGGDGTLHEVANGVLSAGRGSDTAVGFIGQGTGGDFRRTLGITHRLDAYLDALASGRERASDVGALTYRGSDGQERTRWFVNILSAGMGGLVDRYVADTTKAFGAQAAYYVASLRALAVCKRGRLRCTVGLGAESRDARIDTFMIAICNGRYFGGGMHVAPMAAIDDGRFEVVSIDGASKAALLMHSRRIYDASHLSAPGVTHFACDRIAMDIEDESSRGVFLLDVDGEPLGGLPLDVRLEAKALRLLG